MSAYVNNILLGVLTFPFFALVITAPYMIYQYRKYGSIPWWRAFLFYLFVLYLICAYYLVILPLPADLSATMPCAEHPQLMPFQFIRDMVGHVEGSYANPSAWAQLFGNTDFYGAVFNLLLCVPFGAFLRYCYKRTWYQVLIAGFLLSLFFELTQITGLYGIYSHPYRLFDVDDLMLNTLGAMCGYWLIGPAVKVLPDIDVMNLEAYNKGIRPSFFRRILAYAIDTTIMAFAISVVVLLLTLVGIRNPNTLLTFEGYFSFPLTEFIAFLLVFVVVPTLTRGQTAGQKVLKLTIARPDASPAGWYQFLGRYVSLYLIAYLTLFFPNLVINITEDMASQLGAIGQVILNNQGSLAILWLSSLVFWLAFMIVRNQRSKQQQKPFVLLHELLSGTRTFSLLQVQYMRETHNRICEDKDTAEEHADKT